MCLRTAQHIRDVHEWLSGGVSPCQGEGRGFESRLVLLKLRTVSVLDTVLIFCIARKFLRISWLYKNAPLRMHALLQSNVPLYLMRRENGAEEDIASGYFFLFFCLTWGKICTE